MTQDDDDVVRELCDIFTAHFVGFLAEFAQELTSVHDNDNASAELVALARAGDRSGFDALASCLMPADAVADCWAGARARLGLADSAQEDHGPQVIAILAEST